MSPKRSFHGEMENCSSLYTCPDTTGNCFHMESRTAICTCASEGLNAWKVASRNSSVARLVVWPSTTAARARLRNNGSHPGTQDGGLQPPLARAASNNDFKHDLQAPRQASSRPAHGCGVDKDYSRSAAPASKSWKNRWGDQDSTTAAPLSLREGAAPEMAGEGKPWGPSLPGLRRRAATAGAGVGAQNVNSAPMLRLGVGAAGAETVVGETRRRLGVAAAGARTGAGATAGRPALTTVAVEKGDGSQATVTGKSCMIGVVFLALDCWGKIWM
ncbi:unnamed protein product [Ectocarpus sp. CCAP 1310/34]|nr:unnamed protein product [Ectocarpus sp. CCAP 1310/34]